MAFLGSVVLDLRARAEKFIKGVDKARKAQRRLRRGQREIEAAFRSSARAIAAFVGVGGLGMAVKRTLDFHDQLAKLEDRIGAGVRAMSELEHAAQKSGVQFSTLAMGMQRMTRRVSEAAQGTGEARDAIRELGLEARTLATMAPEDQFTVIAEQLSKVRSEGDRTRLAMRLFDSEGVALLQMMTEGAAGLERYREEARKFGKSLSRDAVDGSVAAKDAITDLQAATTGLVNTFVVHAGPTLTAIANFLQNILPDAASIAIESWKFIRIAVGKALEFTSRAISKWASVFSWLPGEIGDIYRTIEEETERFADSLAGTLQEIASAPRGPSLDPFEVIHGSAVKNLGPVNIAVQTLQEETAELRKTQAEAKAIYEATRTPMEQYRAQLEKINALLVEGHISQETANRAIADASVAYRDATRKMEELGQEQKNVRAGMEDVKAMASSVGQTITNAFTNAARTGKFAFKDMVSSILEDMARLVFKQSIADPLTKALGNIMGNAFGGGGFSFGNLFGGGGSSVATGIASKAAMPMNFRARGGPVSSGRPYVVGENGPEVFVPSSSGNVQANAGASGPVNVNFTIHAMDSRDVATALAENRGIIVGIIAEAMGRKGQRMQVL